MPSYKDVHAKKSEIEAIENIIMVRDALELVRICAQRSTSFKEFAALLTDTITQIEEKLK